MQRMCLLLEAFHNCPAGDRLFGEQIGRTKKDADLRTTLGQRGGQGRHHRSREVVMDSTREEDMAIRYVSRWQRFQEGVNHGVP